MENQFKKQVGGKGGSCKLEINDIVCPKTKMHVQCVDRKNVSTWKRCVDLKEAKSVLDAEKSLFDRNTPLARTVLGKKVI